LLVFQAGGDGIRADEAADYGIIVTGAVVVQTGGVQALAGELLIGGNGTGGQPGPAEGSVLDRIQFSMCENKTDHLINNWQMVGVNDYIVKYYYNYSNSISVFRLNSL
jgi:hypothetical protein